MKNLNELTSVKKVEEFIDEHPLSFLYVSRPECSVCHAILPKIRELLDDYPLISLGHVNADIVKEVAEKYLIFTAPMMILMVDQKEYLREDRFVRFERLKERLDQIYGLYTS